MTNKTKRSKRRRPAWEHPLVVTILVDGNPIVGDCDCPLCAEIGRSGTPHFTVDHNGVFSELLPLKTGGGPQTPQRHRGKK